MNARTTVSYLKIIECLYYNIISQNCHDQNPLLSQPNVDAQQFFASESKHAKMSSKIPPLPIPPLHHKKRSLCRPLRLRGIIALHMSAHTRKQYAPASDRAKKSCGISLPAPSSPSPYEIKSAPPAQTTGNQRT